MKILKYLMISLVMIIASCSDDKDDDNLILNGYPKDVTIELKVYSVNNEEVNAHIVFFQDYVKEGEKVATLVEKIDLDDASLPFYKKDKRTVHYLEHLKLIVVVKDEVKEVFAEILVDGKVVAKKSSFETKKINKNNNGMGMVYYFK